MSSPVDEMIAAATRGDLEQVRGLLERDPSLVDAANMFGTTAPHAAYYSARYRMVGLLLYKGPALDGACYWGSVEAARLLLDHGADA